MEQKHALGRRKSAVARVYVVAGTGNIVINGRELNEYFKEETLQYIVNQPFEVTGTTGLVPKDRPRPSVWVSPAPSARSTRRPTALP